MILVTHILLLKELLLLNPNNANYNKKLALKSNAPFTSCNEESAEQRGQVLKILTPSQMLSRLPTILAQLKAGNNSEKLKNEIRQLLYSLYHSKN